MAYSHLKREVMESGRAKKINDAIEKIKEHLDEVSSLGWDIVHEFEDEFGIDNYDWEKIPDKTNREICETANNCGMINTWNEFLFGKLKVNED